MNNVIVKSGLMLVFIIILILLTYAVYEYVQYQQGMHNDRDMARRTIKDFDSKYKSFMKMLKAIIAQNKDNQIKIAQLSSEDTYISAQIKEKDQVIQAKIAKLQESLSQHGGEIETLERQFDKLGNKIQKSKEIQALIKTMRQSNNQLFADLVMTSRQVTDTSSALWNALTQVFNRYLKTNDNIKDLQKKTVANNKTKIDLVQKRLEFRGLMSQYIAEISDINRDIRDLNFSVGTQHDRFQELTQLVNANRISIEALYENYENNKNDIEQLNAQLNEANILRDQMSDRLNAIRDSYTANDDVDVGDTLMDIRGFLDEVQIFIDVCKGAIEIIESANVIILQDINTLHHRINAINSRIDLLENKYDFIDTRIAELNTSNAYIENSLNEISQMHDDSSDDLTSLSDKYAILNTEIASMQQDLNVNDTYIDNIDENMRALFNFRQNGNVITNDLQDQQFNTNDISAFDFRTHATATNGMTISTGNAINDNRNLRVCKKESDNICLHFGIGDNGFNIMPQNVHHFIINDKNNNGLARFDMKNNTIFMGGVDESAALILHNNTAYAKVDGYDPPVVAPPPPDCINKRYISCGSYHTMFLQNDGTVYSTKTGQQNGQTGRKSFLTKIGQVSSPNGTQNQFINNIIQVSAGGRNTMFLKKDGTVYGCGFNRYGQLGIGTSSHGAVTIDDNRNVPTQVIDNNDPTGFLTNIKQVVCNQEGHTLFLKNDNTVYGCGYNSHGQLTNIDKTKTIPYKTISISIVDSPYKLIDSNDSTGFLTNVIQIVAATNRSLFLKNNNTVYGCGYNHKGQLGIGSSGEQAINILTQVVDSNDSSGYLTSVKEISAYGDFSGFLKKNGNVYVCGWNGSRDLGMRPMQVVDSSDSTGFLTNIKQISASSVWLVCLKNDNTVYVHNGTTNSSANDGYSIYVNDNGKVIDNSDSTGILRNIVQVSSGLLHTFFMKRDGTLYVAGNGNNEQTTIPSTNTATKISYKINSPVLDCNVVAPPPVVAPEPEPVDLKNKRISAGDHHSHVITNDGKVYHWGSYYQVKSQEILPLSNIISVSCGNYVSAFLKNDGTVYIRGVDISETPIQVQLTNIIQVKCGGTNFIYLKNDGSVYIRTGSNVSQVNISDIIYVSCGSNHYALLKRDGTVYTFGKNDYGQLGDGTNTDKSKSEPVQILSQYGSNFIQVECGLSHTALLKNDGTVVTFGFNGDGQLGDTSTISNIIQVECGLGHTAFLKNDGTVYAVGKNHLINTNRTYDLTDIVQICCGHYNILFLKNDGTIYGVGYNNQGQLGDGTITNTDVPVISEYNKNLFKPPYNV